MELAAKLTRCSGVSAWSAVFHRHGGGKDFLRMSERRRLEPDGFLLIRHRALDFFARA
jgi:hypothetical protein